jgi:hypothetical protein
MTAEMFEMKHLLLLVSLAIGHVGAEEFRFVHKETTGLSSFVNTRGDKEIAIVITKDSDANAVALLDALLQKQIYGTKDTEDRQGAKLEQAIFLSGEFTSETKRTASGTNTAMPEDYRDFRITGIKIRFPISRLNVAAGGNPIDGPMILETHFSFASLFPTGFDLHGKPVEFSKHTMDRNESK